MRFLIPVAHTDKYYGKIYLCKKIERNIKFKLFYEFIRICIKDEDTRSVICDYLKKYIPAVDLSKIFVKIHTNIKYLEGDSCFLGIILQIYDFDLHTKIKDRIWVTGRVGEKGYVHAVNLSVFKYKLQEFLSSSDSTKLFIAPATNVENDRKLLEKKNVDIVDVKNVKNIDEILNRKRKNVLSIDIDDLGQLLKVLFGETKSTETNSGLSKTVSNKQKKNKKWGILLSVLLLGAMVYGFEYLRETHSWKIAATAYIRTMLRTRYGKIKFESPPKNGYNKPYSKPKNL